MARMTLKKLKEMRRKIQSHPLYDPTLGEDLSPEALAKRLVEELDHVVVARDVPPPLDRLEPGSTVYIEWEGMPAKWMNGVVYVAKRHLKKE